MNVNLIKSKNMLTIGLAILVIGSIWGLLEMTLGGFLHTIHFAQKGAVMGGMAISLMTVFITITKKPLLLPLLGIVAAAFKPFSALIFGQSIASAYVLNPATAIVLEAVAFGLVAYILHRTMEKHLYSKVGAGFLAGGLGIVLYASVASIFGMGFWPGLDMAAKLQTIWETGIPIAITGAFALLIAHYATRFSMPHFASLKNMYPKAYYASSLALVAGCWAIPPIFHL